MTKKPQAPVGPVAAEVPPAPSAECPHPLPSRGGSYVLSADGVLVPDDTAAEQAHDVKEA